MGRKIRVWWPAQESFFEALITGFDSDRAKSVRVQYHKGEEEGLDPSKVVWDFISKGKFLQHGSCITNLSRGSPLLPILLPTYCCYHEVHRLCLFKLETEMLTSLDCDKF